METEGTDCRTGTIGEILRVRTDTRQKGYVGIKEEGILEKIRENLNTSLRWLHN